MKKFLVSHKQHPQFKALVALSAMLAGAHCQAGFLSNLLEGKGQTNQVALTNLVGQAASTNSWSQMLNSEITSLKTNQFSQGLTTNQFSQLLTSLQSTGATNAPATNNLSLLSQKLNGLFGNHFTTSNTNQWYQLVNTALTNHSQMVNTSQLGLLLSSSTNSTAATNQSLAPAISQSLDWLKGKK